MTAGSLTFDLDYYFLTIAAKALEKGQTYKLILPLTLNEDPTETVYSIMLISTIDDSDLVTVIDSSSTTTFETPYTFTYSVPS